MTLRFEPWVSPETYLRYREEQDRPRTLEGINTLASTFGEIGQDRYRRREMDAARTRQAMLDRILQDEERRKIQEQEFKYGRNPEGAMFDEGTTMGRSSFMPGGQGMVSQRTPMEEAVSRYRGQNYPKDPRYSQVHEYLPQWEREKIFERDNPKPQPSYVIPQLDAQGNYTGFTPLPPGTKPTPFAKPPASVTKGILSTPQQQAAYDLYEEARKGLIAGLGQTNTGPIMGRMPAFTKGQQVGQQAIAAMAPVLKQLFRVAGEGVFTDRDQQLLLDMIPTRLTDETAIPEIMANIDNIVKAKLGISRDSSTSSGTSSNNRAPYGETTQRNGKTYKWSDTDNKYHPIR